MYENSTTSKGSTSTSSIQGKILSFNDDYSHNWSTSLERIKVAGLVNPKEYGKNVDLYT